MNDDDLKKRTPRNLLILTVYILIWAAVFMKIEQKDEPNAVIGNRMLKEVKINLSLFGFNVSEQHFFSLVNRISEAVKIRSTPDWGYWESIDFVVQSITTIGFGTLTPRTETGQMVFIFFAMFGMALTMVTLQSTGEILDKCIKKIIVLLERHLLKKQQTTSLRLKGALVSSVLFVILHLYNAKAFMMLNEVTFVEAIYAAFVMLSTIGFGDYAFDFKQARKRLEQLGHASDTSVSVIILLNFPLLLANLSLVSCFLNSLVSLLTSLRDRKSSVGDGTVEGQDNPIPPSSTS